MEAKLNNFSDNLEDELKCITFPREVFPDELQAIVDDYVSALNLNVDYAYGCVLFAFSSAIGTKYRVKVKSGWFEHGVLFIILVGWPGANKSAPIRLFTSPLEKINLELYADYQQKLKAYRAEKASNGDAGQLERPVLMQLVIKDFTMEALFDALANNKHGIVGLFDEIGSLLGSINKYRSGKGNDEQQLLSMHSGSSIYVNRKNVEPLVIPQPFFNVIGSIQPQVLIKTLGNGRIDNGLAHRFLYLYPEDIKREDLSEIDVSEESEKRYEQLIRLIINPKEILSGSTDTKTVQMSKEAMTVYHGVRSRFNILMNNEMSEARTGIWAKLDTYFFRLALVIHVTWCTSKEDENLDIMEISESSAKKAEKLIDYFELMGLRTFNLFDRYQDPLANYPSEHKKTYYQLPEEFTTKEALEISPMKRRSLFNFLSDEHLFEKVRHGFYKKVW